MSDIKEKLTLWTAAGIVSYKPELAELCQEASIEIERLEAQNKRYRDTLRKIDRLSDKPNTFTYLDLRKISVLAQAALKDKE